MKTIQTQIKKFEKRTGFDKTSQSDLIRWAKAEIKDYEKTKNPNKLVDVIILMVQIANRKNISLDKELKKWWIKSKKYIT